MDGEAGTAFQVGVKHSSTVFVLSGEAGAKNHKFRPLDSRSL